MMMKTIGVLGGMSWESTQSYYAALNRGVAARLGGLHSAKVLIHSVDFAEIEALQRSGEWERAGERLAQAARGLEAAGADCMVLATNTMHRVAAAIESVLTVPFLHIAVPTGRKLREDGMRRVGLLGTRFTLQERFYREVLECDYGLDVLVPDTQSIAELDRIIFAELCRGELHAQSRRRYVEAIEALAARGAQGVILGCTEIGLLVSPRDTEVALYDTTRLHVEAALDFALGE